MADIAIWHPAGDNNGFAAKLQSALARKRPHWHCIIIAASRGMERLGLKVLLVILDDESLDPDDATPGGDTAATPLVLQIYRRGLPSPKHSGRALAIDPDDPISVGELIDLIASHTSLEDGTRAKLRRRSKPRVVISIDGEAGTPPPLSSSLSMLGALRSAAILRSGLASPPSAPPVPAPPPTSVRTRGSEQQLAEPLDVSAFAPAKVARGEEALVQIFLHRPDQQADAAALAQESDPAAGRRGVTTLLVAVADGQRVDVLLDVPGATVDQPAQYLVWRGGPCACQFFVSVPPDLARSTLPVRTTVMVDGAPAGSLRFILPVADSAPENEIQPEIKGDSARRYSRAFLSYASPDRAEVLKRAQALKATGVSFFQDLLSLEPGERWEKRLYEEIDRCDLFLLFWSNHARASQWVKKETDLALKRRGHDEDFVPDIVPIVLEGPPLPKPHDDWKHIHFNDWLRYVIAAVEAPPPRP